MFTREKEKVKLGGPNAQLPGIFPVSFHGGQSKKMFGAVKVKLKVMTISQQTELQRRLAVHPSEAAAHRPSFKC